MAQHLNLLTIGTADTHYTNDTATASSQGVNLGVIGTTLGAEGCTGGAPAAAYIESTVGVAAGAKTGLAAAVVGLMFLVVMFFSPLASLVPSYATAPALMYVGLLMLSNVSKLHMDDMVDAMSGLMCAVFIVLTANIVTMAVLGAIVMYLVSMASLFRLRRNEPGLARPYRAPFYPVFPAIALGLGLVCLGAMVWFNGMLTLLFAVLMALAYAYFRGTAAQRAAAAPDDLLSTSS